RGAEARMVAIMWNVDSHARAGVDHSRSLRHLHRQPVDGDGDEFGLGLLVSHCLLGCRLSAIGYRLSGKTIEFPYYGLIDWSAQAASPARRGQPIADSR